MSLNDSQYSKRDNNEPGAVLTSPVTSAALELKSMLNIYERLIALLEETYDEGLDILTDSLTAITKRCREVLAQGDVETAGRQMVLQMREGLREFPQTLRALLPGIGPRLGESLQHKLGIQFSRF